MRSASAASTRSASGSGSSMRGSAGMLVEPRLQDHLRGDFVALRAAATAALARALERRSRVLRRMALVGFNDGKPEAAGEPPRETPRARGHRVLGAVGMHGNADDELVGLPFADQRSDRGEARVARLRVDG